MSDRARELEYAGLRAKLESVGVVTDALVPAVVSETWVYAWKRTDDRGWVLDDAFCYVISINGGEELTVKGCLHDLDEDLAGLIAASWAKD